MSIEESPGLLSPSVTALLDALGVAWLWKPPNNIYVRGTKTSGSAQARSKGRLLHQGTLLVATDLDRMRQLLKPVGRSCIAPVKNLADIVSGITVERTEELLFSIMAEEMSQSHFDNTYAARHFGV